MIRVVTMPAPTLSAVVMSRRYWYLLEELAPPSTLADDEPPVVVVYGTMASSTSIVYMTDMAFICSPTPVLSSYVESSYQLNVH